MPDPDPESLRKFAELLKLTVAFDSSIVQTPGKTAKFSSTEIINVLNSTAAANVLPCKKMSVDSGKILRELEASQYILRSSGPSSMAFRSSSPMKEMSGRVDPNNNGVQSNRECARALIHFLISFTLIYLFNFLSVLKPMSDRERISLVAFLATLSAAVGLLANRERSVPPTNFVQKKIGRKIEASTEATSATLYIYDVSEAEATQLRSNLEGHFPQMTSDVISTTYLKSVLSQPNSHKKSERRTIEYATTKLLTYLEWRTKTKVPEILRTGDEDDLRRDFEDGAVYWKGVVKQGRPILWENSRPWTGLAALIVPGRSGFTYFCSRLVSLPCPKGFQPSQSWLTHLEFRIIELSQSLPSSPASRSS
ncbi:hypothetical protein TrVE_jg9682 [Triparma verrucosa]|uniref:Uncharacterized protein n=1 Tax=Triparma verrucosa TaxID=1606542 RepID=A0A9W7BHF7_9STRA|nr:hypothetical protein TrVE_jg9682 [Triparma verrucosa]